MQKAIALLVISSLFLSAVNAGKPCYVLAIQGGTTQAAYTAGAIQGLVKNLPAGQAAYDVVTGSGSSGITAALAALYPKGQEAAMAQNIVNFWQSLQPHDLWKNWLTGIIQGLLAEPGLYNTAPAVTFFSKIFKSPPNGRYFSMGTTNANDATYWLFNNFNGPMNADAFNAAIRATWATPGIIPYVNYGSQTLVDGSILKNLDIAAGVIQCRAINGKDDSNIFVDTILLHEKTWSADVTEHTHTIKMLQLTLKLTSQKATMYDIEKAKWDFPNVNFRYTVAPSQKLPTNSHPYDFTAKEKAFMINLGLSDAARSISAGPGVMWADYSNHVSQYLRSTHGPNAMLKRDEEHAKLVQALKKAFAEELAREKANQTIQE